MNTEAKKNRCIDAWWSARKSVLKPTAVSLFLAALVLGFPSVAIAQLPCFGVDVTGNHIYCANWKPDTPLNVITSSGGRAQTITGPAGFAIFSLPVDIRGGDVVTVWGEHPFRPGEEYRVSYTVTNLMVTSVDTCNDRVSGTADPGSLVLIRPWLDGLVPNMDVIADGSGHWVADFTAVGFDLQDGNQGQALQTTNVFPVYCSTGLDWHAGPCVPSVGEVVAFSGDVYVNDIPAQDLDSLELEKLDEVRTDSDGQVEIQFDETTVNLDADSGMTVAESTTSTKTSLADFYGRMKAKVANLSGRSFEAQTPAAVTSSRGTEMIVEATPFETRILMLEHDADVSTLDGSQSLVLQELQGVVVTAGGIGIPFPVSPNEIERWWEQLVISVASPVNLYVTDPLGRHIGCDPTGLIVNEIPGAIYSGPTAVPEEVTIPGPVQGDYGIELIPVGTGNYHLTVAGMGLGKESFLNEYTGSVEASGETVHFEEGYESAEELLQGEIDVKPGTFPNDVNLRSRGRLPVAVLTTENFDAASVDCVTVRFGADGMEAEPVHHAMEDVDGDDDLDLILHFRTRETGIECGDTSANLTGLTFGGVEIHGRDSVSTVGCEDQ